MRTSRFNVALNDSAGAPAALEPTAPMDWVTSSLLHSAAKSLEVWTDPWPAWSTAPFRLPRVAAACWRASMTKGGVRMLSRSAQATRRRPCAVDDGSRVRVRPVGQGQVGGGTSRAVGECHRRTCGWRPGL